MDVAQQVFEEGDDLLTGERAMMQSSGQVNALPCWADQQGADDIDATVMRDAGMHHRRLTPWCPGAFERRNQRKPALVFETQACAQVTPLFLSAASDSAANARSPHHRETAPGAGVSGCSSPCDAAHATPRWGDSVCRTTSRSRVRYGQASSNPGHSHEHTPRALARVPVCESAWRLGVLGGRVSYAGESPRCSLLGTSVRPCACSHPLETPLAGRSVLLPTSSVLVPVAHPLLRSILVSSCPLSWHIRYSFVNT